MDDKIADSLRGPLRSTILPFYMKRLDEQIAKNDGFFANKKVGFYLSSIVYQRTVVSCPSLVKPLQISTKSHCILSNSHFHNIFSYPVCVFLNILVYKQKCFSWVGQTSTSLGSPTTWATWTARTSLRDTPTCKHSNTRSSPFQASRLGWRRDQKTSHPLLGNKGTTKCQSNTTVLSCFSSFKFILKVNPKVRNILKQYCYSKYIVGPRSLKAKDDRYKFELSIGFQERKVRVLSRLNYQKYRDIEVYYFDAQGRPQYIY